MIIGIIVWDWYFGLGDWGWEIGGLAISYLAIFGPNFFNLKGSVFLHEKNAY